MPRLAAVLAAGGCEVVTTREPGSTPLGELMRRLVLDTDPPIDRGGRADALLFAASRAQHVDEVISPALARGAVVLCDRYADSSLAYQGAGSGVPMDQLREVQRFATGGLVPDLTILLDLPVEVGLRPQVGRDHPVRGVPGHRVPRAGPRGVPGLRGGRAGSLRDRGRDRRARTAVLAGAVEAVRRVAGRLPCLAAALERAGAGSLAERVRNLGLRATSTIEAGSVVAASAARAAVQQRRGIGAVLREARDGGARPRSVWPSTASSFAMPSSTRRATVTPAGPGATSTNSSPPVRAIVSTSRTLSASTRRHLAQDVVPGTGPGRGVQLAEAVDVEQRDGDLRCPAAARARPPAPGPAPRSARWRGPSADP